MTILVPFERVIGYKSNLSSNAIHNDSWLLTNYNFYSTYT